MGFSDSFIRWVRLRYTDVRSSVLVNGYTSCLFKPSRAVSVRSLVTLFISVLHNVIRVCLPRSPLLAVLWCSWLFFFCLSVCVFPLFAPPRSPSLVLLRFSWALTWLCLSVRVSLLASPLGRLCWFHYGFVSSDRFE